MPVRPPRAAERLDRARCADSATAARRGERHQRQQRRQLRREPSGGHRLSREPRATEHRDAHREHLHRRGRTSAEGRAARASGQPRIDIRQLRTPIGVRTERDQLTRAVQQRQQPSRDAATAIGHRGARAPLREQRGSAAAEGGEQQRGGEQCACCGQHDGLHGDRRRGDEHRDQRWEEDPRHQVAHRVDVVDEARGAVAAAERGRARRA